MEIKTITKTDGKRMFVELSREMIEPKSGLPSLKKGDEIVLLAKRKFTDAFLNKMIGKQVSGFIVKRVSQNHVFYHEVKGILVKNKDDFWPKHDPTERYSKEIEIFLEGKKDHGEDFALVEYSSEFPDGKPTHKVSSKSLSGFYDVQFSDRVADVDSFTPCSNQKCKFRVHRSFRFCPKCGKNNPIFKRVNK